jgi:hypothetical protein
VHAGHTQDINRTYTGHTQDIHRTYAGMQRDERVDEEEIKVGEHNRCKE